MRLRESWARRRRLSVSGEATTGLVFDSLPGRIVAVCGLAGGAGTTTIAYQLAAQAARESSGPVLVCESEALLGGLAVIAGRGSKHGLGGVADELAGGGALDPLPVTELAGGLALLAAMPRPAPVVGDVHLRAVLDAGRRSYPLVVVDCRTPDHPHCPALLAASTHILWVVPLAESSVRAATMLEAARVLPPAGRTSESLVAVAVRPRSNARLRSLAQLAERRGDRLILVPHLEAQADSLGARDGEALLAALTELATVLRGAHP